MKKKSFFTVLLTSTLVSVIVLIVYIQFFDNKDLFIRSILEQDNNRIPAKNVAMNFSDKLVDFTEAADKSIHAVVHIKTKINQDYYSNPLTDFFLVRHLNITVKLCLYLVVPVL